jgi:hypothetical protein
MDSLIRVVTNKADELARQYNKNKDPGIRDQWYKLLKTLPPISEDTHPIFRKKTKQLLFLHL